MPHASHSAQIRSYRFESPDRQRTLTVSVDPKLVDLMVYRPTHGCSDVYEAFAIEQFHRMTGLPINQANRWTLTDITPQLEMFPDE